MVKWLTRNRGIPPATGTLCRGHPHAACQWGAVQRHRADVGTPGAAVEELGVTTRGEVLEESDSFSWTTKVFQDGLEGEWQQVTTEMYDIFQECNRANAKRLDLDADVVMIHDPQPAALIDSRGPYSKWIWCCHVDLSRPQRSVSGLSAVLCRPVRGRRPFVTSSSPNAFPIPSF